MLFCSRDCSLDFAEVNRKNTSRSYYREHPCSYESKRSSGACQLRCGVTVLHARCPIVWTTDIVQDQLALGSKQKTFTAMRAVPASTANVSNDRDGQRQIPSGICPVYFAVINSSSRTLSYRRPSIQAMGNQKTETITPANARPATPKGRIAALNQAELRSPKR